MNKMLHPAYMVGVAFLSWITELVWAEQVESKPEQQIVAAFEYPGRAIEDDRKQT